MTDWLRLLAGSVLGGTAVVWAMVLPRRSSVLAALAAALSSAVAITSASAVADHYRTAEAVAAALCFLVVGGATGYALSAAALPAIATRRPAHDSPPAEPGPKTAVVLLACTDPERYDPRAVAMLGVELVHDGAIDIPLFTTPLVYLAEKARYRAFGGRSPGPALARSVAAALAVARPDTRVGLAWTYDRPTLADTLAELEASGTERIAVVVLGTTDSTPVERALTALDAGQTGTAHRAVCVAPSLWLDRPLTERLAERILDSIEDRDRLCSGVVLLCAGQPPVAGSDRSGAVADDMYFNQRVRMLLVDAGIQDARVRIAWIEWQQPDLTDAVRHLAALGCTRIVIASSTIALPTVSTSLDIGHAIDAARLPQTVSTAVLAPWGDDPVLVQAVLRSAEDGLRQL